MVLVSEEEKNGQEAVWQLLPDMQILQAVQRGW
jgi:hypothetical protein